MRSYRFVILLLAAGPAMAQQPQDSARYAMTPIEGGMIRLDRRTGAVSTCRLSGTDLVCRGATDDRSGYEDEIARLNRENEGLRQRLTAVPRLQMPDERDIDEALGVFDKFMRRFKGIVDDWRHDDNGARRT